MNQGQKAYHKEIDQYINEQQLMKTFHRDNFDQKRVKKDEPLLNFDIKLLTIYKNVYERKWQQYSFFHLDTK